jgi:hypothetical protein
MLLPPRTVLCKTSRERQQLLESEPTVEGGHVAAQRADHSSSLALG